MSFFDSFYLHSGLSKDKDNWSEWLNLIFKWWMLITFIYESIVGVKSDRGVKLII